MSDKKVSDNPTDTTEGSESGNQAGAIPPEVVAFMEEARGKFTQFGKDLGKVRERLPKSAGEPDKANGTEAPVTPGVTQEQLSDQINAAMAVGRLEGSLGKEQLASAQKLKAELGLDNAAYAKLLENLPSPAGASPQGNNQHTHGATPGTSRASTPHPKSMAEWQKLTTAQKDELTADATFDIMSIRR